jgi:FtsP/CotA-like multicopper oxidase with cupredoxin domain
MLKAPVTMHPHGIFYANEMDGTYKGKWTDPGGFVQPGRTFTYVWECHEGTEGTWLYHDHGPMDPLPVFKGLHGPLVIRKPGEARPEAEFFLAFHTWDPSVTGLNGIYYCINGKAYAGNTPNLEAKVGQRVAFHVYGVDNFFHTFHVHGHRWTEPDGTIVDNKTFGPADSFRVEFVEDNPGRWFYHCHVFQHLHQGMNGWYLVS